MDPMEEIWNKVSKPAKDGNRYIFLKGLNDLAFLYISGFVDIKKYNFKSWMDAFASSRKKDGSYIVDHDRWLEKKKFRFSGRIGKPFDPMTLEERDYTEPELVKLLTDKIIPCTMYDDSYIPVVLNQLRAQKRLVNGKVRINTQVKQYVTALINAAPSPTRILEFMVDTLKKSKDSKFAMSQLQRQKSGFAAGQTAEQIAHSRLAEIAKEIQKEIPAATDAPAISLKDLKKKRPSSGRI